MNLPDYQPADYYLLLSYYLRLLTTLITYEGITYNIHFFTYFFLDFFQKRKKIEPARIYYLRDHCDLLTMIS